MWFNGSMTQMKTLSRILALVLGLLLMFAGVAPAKAASTPALVSSITAPITDDTSGQVLDKDRLKPIIDQVNNEAHLQFYVVYTDSFNGQTGSQWALAKAKSSNLDPSNSLIFGVAVKDHKYGSAYNNAAPVASRISTVEDAAKPSLRSGDWNGAVEAYGKAAIKAVNSPSGSTASTPVNWSAIWTVIGAAALIVTLIALFLLGAIHLRKRNTKRREDASLSAALTEINQNNTRRLLAVEEKYKTVSEKVDFVAAMYSGLSLVTTAKNALVAVNSALLRVPTERSKITYKGDAVAPTENSRVGVYHTSDAIKTAEDKLTEAEKALTRIDQTVAERDATITASAKTLAGIDTEREMAQNDIDAVKSVYNATYLRNLSASVTAWDKAIKDYRGAVNTLNKASLEGTDAAEDKVKGALRKVKTAQRKFDAAMEYVTTPDVRRDKSFAHLFGQIASSGDMLDEFPALNEASRTAEAAVEVAKRIDLSTGNPDAALSAATGPISTFLDMLGKVKATRQKNRELRKNIVDTVNEHTKTAARLIGAYEAIPTSARGTDKPIMARRAQRALDDMSDAGESTKAALDADQYGTAPQVTESFRAAVKTLEAALRPLSKTVERHQEDERRRIAEAAEAERKRRERKRREDEDAARRRLSLRRAGGSPYTGIGIFGGSSSSSSSSSWSSSSSDFGGGSSWGSSGGDFGGGSSGGSW